MSQSLGSFRRPNKNEGLFFRVALVGLVSASTFTMGTNASAETLSRSASSPVKLTSAQIRHLLPGAIQRMRALGLKCKSTKKSDVKKYQGPRGACDNDKDGLPNLLEKRVGTNYRKKDTDGDGLTDRQELLKYHTDPRNADTDGDGLTDGDEINRTHTDPLNPDTDGNGIDDGVQFPPPSTTPIPTPGPNDCSANNFDASGNTVQFNIPSPLVGNVARGQAVYKTQTCFRCHTMDKGTNQTFPQLKTVVTGPLMNPALTALGLVPSDQQFADLVAYLNQTQTARVIVCPATATPTPTPFPTFVATPTPTISATPGPSATPSGTPCPGGNFDVSGNTTAFSIPAPLIGNITSGQSIYTQQTCFRCHGTVELGIGLTFPQLKTKLTSGTMVTSLATMGLTPNDQAIANLVAFLNRSYQGGNCSTPPPSPTPVDDITLGRAVYLGQCESCHHNRPPDYRSITANKISKAIRDVREMRSIVLSTENMRVLVLYIRSIP